MISQVKKMTSLIDGFLNLSLFKAERIEKKKDWFEMEVLLNDIREELAMTSSSHQIMINCPRDFNLRADREKIASVIYNLLSNSIKYSPIGKQIVVDCVIDGDSKIFTVTDVGMGI